MNTYRYTDLFFDFDGTLCDTKPDIQSCLVKAMEILHISCPDFYKIHRVGPTLESMTRRLLPNETEETVQRVIDLYLQLYTQSGYPKTRPYPGVVDMLTTLQAQGRRIFLATNKRLNATKTVLGTTGLAHFFTDIYCPDKIAGELVSKAELLKRALTEYHLNPAASLMVGDMTSDLEAGRAAGMPVAAVTWGYGDLESLTAAAPELLLEPGHILIP